MNQNVDRMERILADTHVKRISELRGFLEWADDLEPFKDPIVRDDLETIMAILYGGEVPE